MAQGITSENHQFSYLVSESSILGATGFSFSLASFLIGIYSTALSTQSSGDPTAFASLRGISLLCAGITYFVIYRFVSHRESMVRSNALKTVFFCLQILLPLIHLIEFSIGIIIPLWVIVVAWACWGVASSFMACSWIDGLSNVDEKRIGAITCVAFLVAGALVTSVLAMTMIFGTIVYTVMILASYVILLKAKRNAPPDIEAANNAWLNEKGKFRKNGSYVLLVDGIILANVACFCVIKIIRLELPPVIMGLSLLATTALFALTKRSNPSVLSLETSQLVFLPVIICCLQLMTFLTSTPQIVVATIAFVTLFVFEISNTSILAIRGSVLSLSPSFCFAKGRIYIVIGQGIGWLIGAFLSTTSTRYLPALFTLFAFLVCLYIAVTALMSDRYPLLAKETPLYVQDSIDISSAASAQQETKLYGRPFKEKCSKAAAVYGLTPREGEILFFLAKGRNARYIADKLFVAERTIKTHTYHIYQKMEVHSQQELIDIVEEGAPSPEKP